MSARTPTLVSWSGGKDSALALLELRHSATYEVVGLMTTFDPNTGRIAYHNVHRDLVRAQAAVIGLPLYEVPLTPRASNIEYEAAVQTALAKHPQSGALAVAYGDIFLEDIRTFREVLAARLGFKPVFPNWGLDTHALVRKFIALKFEAVVVSVDLALLDQSQVGRSLDTSFIAELPPDVDPCGENGEFHTFVTNGPIFSKAVSVTNGALPEID